MQNTCNDVMKSLCVYARTHKHTNSPPHTYTPHLTPPPSPRGALTLLVEVDRGGRERGLDAVGEGVTLYK